VGIVVGAAQERIGSQVPVKGSLELRLEVAARYPAEDLAVRLGEAGVAGSAATAAFLEQFLTDTHGHQSASLGGVTPSLAWSPNR
jgi:hypothetical protein